MTSANITSSSTSKRPSVPLEMLVDTTLKQCYNTETGLTAFLNERNPAAALKEWLRIRPNIGNIQEIRTYLRNCIAEIDQLISQQVNSIIHHERFQQLESSWRGLQYLVDRADEYERQTKIKVKILDLSWRALVKDLNKASDFDQSQFFNHVYSQELDMAGGEPFGVLLGDYEVSHKPRADQPTDDVRALELISQVAAAAFAPFITGAHPSLLGLDDFSELSPLLNLDTTFQQTEYIRWNSLRSHVDTRFIGIVLPKVLMRSPYKDDGTRNDGLSFKEVANETKQYLWGNAIYPFGGVIMRAFGDSGWFAEIRGQQRNTYSAGLAAAIATQHRFGLESSEIDRKMALNTAITERLDKQLAEYGFIPARHCEFTNHIVFYSNNALLKPESYDTLAAATNARLSSMLQYMLCVSRFAHYIKIIGRDRIGSLTSTQELESELHHWLMKYATSDDNISTEMKAKYPLHEANVEIKEKPGTAGKYECVIHLRPHYQLDQLTSSIQLVTELVNQST